MYIFSNGHVSVDCVVRMVWKRVSDGASFSLFWKRMLLRMRSAMATTPPTSIMATPPICIRHTMSPAPMNATPAVMNHPPMTEITPVMRNTALSRPHARSARDVPIATMKVTKVVDKGSFMDVPTAISTLASMRLSAPRTRSNAAPSSSCVTVLSMRRFTQCLMLSGVRSLTHDEALSVALTSERPKRENNVDYLHGDLLLDFEFRLTEGKRMQLTHFYSNTGGNDRICYFTYNPQTETVQQAYRDANRHKLLCSSPYHLQYYDKNNNKWIAWPTWGGHSIVKDSYIANSNTDDDFKGCAVRGQTITLDLEDCNVGDAVVFYLANANFEGSNYHPQTYEPKNDYIASTRAVLNQSWKSNDVLKARNTALAGLMKVGDAYYWGFEDALELTGTDKPNGDYDLNDVVFVIKGDYEIFDPDEEDITGPKDPEPTDKPMSYIIAYEDLGASYDFDFNDIVAKVTHVSGSKEASLEILAAGGTLPVELLYDGSTICGNVHEDLFGVSNETVVNATGNHKQYPSKTIPINLENADDFSLAKIGIKVTQEDGVKTEIYAPQYYGVSLTSEGTLIEGAISNERKIPYAILIANPNWVWPDEYVSIATKYPDFNDWVKDASRTNWYGSIWGETQSGGGTTPPITDPDEPGGGGDESVSYEHRRIENESTYPEEFEISKDSFEKYDSGVKITITLSKENITDQDWCNYRFLLNNENISQGGYHNFYYNSSLSIELNKEQVENAATNGLKWQSNNKFEDSTGQPAIKISIKEL